MVLDQVVVRVLRKRERVQPQRVDRGFPDHLQPARGRGEMVQVEADDVVAEQEGALPGERVKPPERGGGIAGPVDQRGLAVRPDRREGEDARGGGIDLEVDRDAVPEQRRGMRGRGSDPVFHRSASRTSSQTAENIPTFREDAVISPQDHPGKMPKLQAKPEGRSGPAVNTITQSPADCCPMHQRQLCRAAAQHRCVPQRAGLGRSQRRREGRIPDIRRMRKRRFLGTGKADIRCR